MKMRIRRIRVDDLKQGDTMLVMGTQLPPTEDKISHVLQGPCQLEFLGDHAGATWERVDFVE
jgi:hypothetical protein